MFETVASKVILPGAKFINTEFIITVKAFNSLCISCEDS